MQTRHLIYIILDESWGVAGSLSEIFYTLQVRGVINSELAEKMISMVGFRNILIHECNEVDLGADGFIGSHLTEELIRHGANVRAFVFYNFFNSWGWLDTFPKDKLDKLDVFTGDVRDPNGVRKVMFQNSSFFKGDVRRGLGLQELSSARP